MKVKIDNWKTLWDQFELEDRNSGLKSATELSRILEQTVKLTGAKQHVHIPCNERSEAIAMFEYIGLANGTVYYEYTGTAN